MFQKDREDEAARALLAPEGINELYPYEAGATVKSVLLDPNSNFWKKGGDGETILQKAAENPTVQKNALRLLELLLVGSYQGAREFSADKIKEFFTHKRLIKLLWEAAIATPYQFRMLSNIREVREKIIFLKVAENQLANPDWLKEKPKAETRKGRKTLKKKQKGTSSSKKNSRTS